MRIGNWHRVIASRDASSGAETLPSPTMEGTELGSRETMPAVRDAREYALRATPSSLRDVGQLQARMLLDI